MYNQHSPGYNQQQQGYNQQEMYNQQQQMPIGNVNMSQGGTQHQLGQHGHGGIVPGQEKEVRWQGVQGEYGTASEAAARRREEKE